MFFKQKRVDALRDLIKQAFKDISQGDFDKALKSYTNILNRYNYSKNEDRAKIEDDYQRLLLELRIYMYIKETEVLLNFNDFKKIKEKLDEINTLSSKITSRFDDTIETLNYSRKKFLEFTRAYEQKFNIHEFNKLYLQIFKHLKHKEVQLAIQEYHALLDHYKIILKYETPKKYTPKLNKLLEAIEHTSLINRAYELVKEEIVTSEIPEYTQMVHREVLPTETQDFSKDFDKIHELLEKNKADEAEKLYQNL